MHPDEKNIQSVKSYKILLPIIIGLAVAAFLFYREYHPGMFSSIVINRQVIVYVLLAFLMMVLRDFGYMLRIKILAGGQYNWKNAFQVIMLWEFTSAITPSAVGGTSVAVLYVHKEGIRLGKSTAIVLATSFLDELYFILFFPMVFLVITPDRLFGLHSAAISFSSEYFYFAVTGYLIKLLYILLVFYGLFINPSVLRRILTGIFRLKFLKKWQLQAEKVGSDIVTSSGILKREKPAFWLGAFLATVISWSARYLVVNFLLLALYAAIEPDKILSISDHILLFARQLAMWIMLLVMPSPGGSGFAEAIFSDFLSDFIPVGFVSILAFSWRVITYYPYLIIGSVLFPSWLNKHFVKKEKND